MIRTRVLRQGLFVSLLAAGALLSTAAFPIVYVSPAGDNSNGNSWATAYTSVQPALDAGAAQGEDIWVAEGTYSVSTPLTLGNDISIYGGFPASGNPDFSDRDPSAHESVLDGGGTANHVINIDNVSNPRIDGFSIIGGKSVTFGYDGGGGIRVANISGGNCTIEQCRFINNTSNRLGGAIIAIHSPVTIANCVFQNNSATEGGAVMGYYGVLTIADSLFEDSVSSAAGGSVGCYDGALSMARCIVRNGVSSSFGAGIEAHESGPMILEECTFEGNQTSGEAGGVSCHSCVSLSMSKCIITGNSAGGFAGGVQVYDTPAAFDGCIVTDNTGTLGGGIEFHGCGSCTTSITNCVFLSNTATQDGGGVFAGDGGQVVVANCTFAGNAANQYGGGVYVRNSPTDIVNSIFSTNSGVAIYEAETAYDATVRYGCFHDNENGIFYDVDTATTFTAVSGPTGLQAIVPEASGNIEGDPLFADILQQDFHLSYGSPCIDSGSDTGAPDHDYDGDSRPLDIPGAGLGIFDIGADELRDDDGDRLPNYRELIYGTDPQSADTDRDGLGDALEVGFDGSPAYNPYDLATNPSGTDTDALDPDTDGDGVFDGTEAMFSYDPLDASSVPQLPLSFAATAIALLAVGALASHRIRRMV